MFCLRLSAVLLGLRSALIPPSRIPANHQRLSPCASPRILSGHVSIEAACNMHRQQSSHAVVVERATNARMPRVVALYGMSRTLSHVAPPREPTWPRTSRACEGSPRRPPSWAIRKPPSFWYYDRDQRSLCLAYTLSPQRLLSGPWIRQGTARWLGAYRERVSPPVGPNPQRRGRVR